MKKWKIHLTPLALLNTIIVFAVSLVFVVGVLIIIYNITLNKGVASETFYNSNKPMIIISESMEPTIMTNSLLMMSDTSFEHIEVGDIIMFDTSKYGMVIHRIVEETESGFITKGDNNKLADEWVVTKDMYKGKVEVIYNEVASVISFLFGNLDKVNTVHILFGFVFIALVLTGIVVIFNWVYDYIFIVYFLKKDMKDKEKNAKRVQENYYSWIVKRVSEEEIENMLQQLNEKRSFIEFLIFRFRVMQVHNALQDEEKQVKKIRKRYEKLKRSFDKYD